MQVEKDRAYPNENPLPSPSPIVHGTHEVRLAMERGRG